MLKKLKNAKNIISGMSVIIFLLTLLFILLVVRHDYFHLFNNYFYSTLDSTHDLNAGDFITYKGIIIGRIADFELDNNRIKFKVLIKKKYSHLVRTQSRLRLTPPFNLKGAIFGASLELLQSNPDAPRLQNGQGIPTVKSQISPDLSELVASAQEQVKLFVENLNKAFNNDPNNPEAGASLVKNLMQTSHNINEISKNFIQVTKQADEGLLAWTTVGRDTSEFISHTQKDIHMVTEKMNDSLKKFDIVLNKSSGAIDKVDDILLEAKTSIESVNLLLSKVSVLLDEVHDVTYKVNNSWILRGKPEKDQALEAEKLQFINE